MADLGQTSRRTMAFVDQETEVRWAIAEFLSDGDLVGGMGTRNPSPASPPLHLTNVGFAKLL